MRFITAGIVVGSLLFASVATAAEGKKGSDNQKGGPGPGGGSTSADSSSPTEISGHTSAPSLGDVTEEEDEGGRANPDKVDPFARAYKPWEVGLAFTTHRMVIQNDLAGGDATNGSPGSGAGADKMVNDYEMYVRYDITKHDRVSIRAYVFERFLADPGENGLRFDDMAFTYTHSITLPRKFNLSLGFMLTAPTSFESYLAGTITTPRLSVGVDRRFGPLDLSARTYAQYDIQTEASYADGAGGAPTSLFHVGVVADAELHMPFHEPLSVGIGATTGYIWYHNISGGPAVSADPQFSTQPIQQSYGGEAYMRYVMPTLAGFKPDVTLAYGMGGPSVGYTSFLHDGVGHLYLGYRENSEFYLRFAVAY